MQKQTYLHIIYSVLNVGDDNLGIKQIIQPDIVDKIS